MSQVQKKGEKTHDEIVCSDNEGTSKYLKGTVIIDHN